jgi:hypothetical protein
MKAEKTSKPRPIQAKPSPYDANANLSTGKRNNNNPDQYKKGPPSNNRY